MTKFLHYVCLSIALVAVFVFQPAQAARLYISPEHLIAGADCQAQLRVASEEGEVLNAMEGKVTFPSFIAPANLAYGGSVVSIWLDTPRISSDSIEFSGITPGGFSGDREILHFACPPLRQGSGRIDIARGAVYIHDGLGTIATTSLSGAAIEALWDSSTTIEVYPTDKKPPETFVPQIVSDPDLNNGALTIIFNAQDKESGIARYEVLQNGVWVLVSSPYRIPDQSLRSPVYVRAIDNAGNFIVVQLASSTPVQRLTTANRTPLNYWHFATYGVVLLLLLWVFVRVIAFYRRRSS
jgi:hypothetical protein